MNRAAFLSTCFACTLTALPALALDDFSVNGNLSAGQTWDPSGGSDVYGFQAYQITVVDVDSFLAEVSSSALSGGFWNDADLYLYTEAFDANAPSVGFLAYADDGSGTNPVAWSPAMGSSAVPSKGSYTLVVTTYEEEVYGAFVLDVDGAVLGWGNSMAELAATTSSFSRLAVQSAQGIVSSQGQSSLATRQSRMTATRRDGGMDGPSVTLSTRDTPGMMGSLFAWVEPSGFDADDGENNREYDGAGLQFGADIPIAYNMVAGLSFGASAFNTKAPALAQEGTLYFVQPYLAYDTGPWSGEASVIYGQSEYDQADLFGLGEGETELYVLTFLGGYDVDYAGAIVTPQVGFYLGQEDVEGTGGTLAGAEDETIDFGQVSLGARYTRSFAGGSYFSGLHADYQETDAQTTAVSRLLVDDGWTGRVEVGGTYTLFGGSDIDASVAFGGIGGDLRQVSGGLRLSYSF